ncbi:MAG: PAS domain S-box protein [Candidatus Omnitrophica bacterium]|nr:PAS domain S-box protein [Candidatus Omnitrophota bacterium]
MGKDWFDNFIPENIRGEIKDVFNALLSEQEDKFVYKENAILTKTKEEKVLLWHNALLKDKEGQIVGTVSSGQDITKYKEIERQYLQNLEYYRLLADNTVDIIWTANLKLEITYISPSVKRLLGYEPAELINSSAEKILSKSSFLEAVKTLAEAITEDGSLLQKDLRRFQILELEHICKDGSPVWCELSVNFLRDEKGKPIGLVGISRDITERKDKEEEIKNYLRELEIFYKASIDREERILELKEEIMRLKEKLKAYEH